MPDPSKIKRIKVSVYLDEDTHRKLRLNYGSSIQEQIEAAAREAADRINEGLSPESIVKNDDPQVARKNDGESATPVVENQIKSGLVQVPVPEAHVPWVQRLLRILQSTREGLAKAIKLNLEEFEWAAERADERAKQQTEAVPGQASALGALRPSPRVGAGDDEHPGSGDENPVTDEDVDRAVERAKEAGRRREQGAVGNPRKARKGRPR
jgi:hypothetical protein